MPKKKQKYNARFPPARIKKIMQTDEEVGKVAAAVPVIISRSLELFVESLIKKTSEITQGRNAKTLTTTHLKQCILNESQFDFLKELVDSVPDVQGDEDCSNPAPDVRPPAQRLKKQRVRKLGKKSDDSAGPSQTATEESEDAETDEEDEYEEDDDEESKSEDNSQALKSLYLNNQGNMNYVTQSPNGATSVIVNPIPLHTYSSTTTHIDEDYDS